MEILDLLKIALTSIGSVVVLFLLTKIIGKRQMSQLSMFDYINGITIGSIAAEMATSLEGDFLKPLVAMIIYAGMSVLISLATCKSIQARRLLVGKSTILYDNGKLYERNLKKAKYDMGEFLEQCRVAGYFDLKQVQTAILEPNGRLSFLPVSDQRPLTASDMGVKLPKESILYNVILDGYVLEENLKQTGNNRAWLEKKLKENGVKKLEEVFLATCDGNNSLCVYQRTHKIEDRDPFQ